MTTYCKKCNKAGLGYPYCEQCGGKLSPMSTCNWCRMELWPHMRHCPGCGRSRYEAFNTSPLPPKVLIRSWWNESVVSWWNKLIGKSANGNVES